MTSRKIASGLAALLAAAYFATFFTLHLLKWRYYDPGCPDVGGLLEEFLAVSNGWFDFRMLSSLIFTTIQSVASLGLIVFRSQMYVLALSPLFTALQIVLVFLIARRVIDSPWLALVLATAYALNPIVEFYSFIGFKPEPIGIFALFLFVLFVLKRNRKGATIAIVVACLSKIDLPPVAFLLAAGFYNQHRKEIVRPALIIAGVVSAVYGIAAVALFTSGMLTSGVTEDSTLAPIFSMINTGGIAELVWIVFSPFSMRLWLALFPVAFFALARPYFTFVPAIFHISITMLFASVWEHGQFGQVSSIYPETVWLHGPRPSVVWVALIFIGTIFSIKRILSWTKKLPAWTKFSKMAIGAALLLCSGLYHTWAGNPAMGPLPLSEFWTEYRYRYEPSDRSRHIDAVLDNIERSGETACMTQQYPYYSDSYLHPYETNRPIGIPCMVAEMKPQWVLVDLYMTSFPTNKERLDWTLKLLNDPVYDVESFFQGVILFKKSKHPSNSSTARDQIRSFIEENRELLARSIYDSQIIRALVKSEPISFHASRPTEDSAP